ncbi:hypothetical protein M427DRAFT_50803 [Gonapodya prolifera JEL478]|uniref:FAR-17a/AIG1-like protein n=1 Tax=Gonapodya prolifera (strain JEL478) TaxID=1344416 RepID=A0A139B0M2_GONPJ|nr:hypothetical protein M427DRAFT_50803 [Gonapodya prolifera JEL478]|eukprot:KXS22490.1 hypothetical protein M427DRAFT_50803 [Gonapodya prolifera JEL478]
MTEAQQALDFGRTMDAASPSQRSKGGPTDPKTFSYKIWKWHRMDLFDPVRPVSSFIVPTSVLLCVRVLFLLYGIIVHVYTWVQASRSPLGFWSWAQYFTDMTYFGLIVYFGVISFHTLIYFRGVENWTLDKWHWGFNLALWYLYESAVAFHPVVVAVFWTVLAPSVWSSQAAYWNNLSKHGLELLFIYVDVILNRWDHLMFTHIPLILVIVLLWMFWSWIFTATHPGMWTYPFMDYHKTSNVVYYLALPVAFVISFIVGKYLHLAKERLATKLGLARRFQRVVPKEEKTPDHQLAEMSVPPMAASV